MHTSEQAEFVVHVLWEYAAVSWQLGLKFVHEHPSHARSWQRTEIKALAVDERVHPAHIDQRMYGLQTRGPNSVATPAMETTKLSATHAARRKRCNLYKAWRIQMNT